MESIAIIGTGIAGLGCGYFLKDRFNITFYEKNDYPGGHTNTVTIDEDGRPVHIDSGFMVYNEITYPNLVRLFKELDVSTKPTSMSFSVQHVPSGLEYCGTGLSGLFAQRRNLLNVRFIRMLLEIDRFNRESVRILDDEKYSTYSLADYSREHRFSDDFLNYYLVPMSSAVWSTPPELMLEFPILSLVRFFKNHGFLGLTTHYQWRTVTGGSRTYRDKILSFFKGNVLLNNAAQKIIRENGKIAVHDSKGQKAFYDKVVLACHGDQALRMLVEPTETERTLLKEFRYQKNKVTLHTDSSIMPRTRRAWSSWNYRLEAGAKGGLTPTTIYYMNSLQQVSDKRDYFVSINDPGRVDPDKVLWETWYEHPLYSVEAYRAQKELPKLNQNGKIYFCGSYFKYGFHEDALTSGLAAARAVSGEKIWE